MDRGPLWAMVHKTVHKSDTTEATQHTHTYLLFTWERPCRDLFEKIIDTKGTFHAKMGSIKNRNSRDLTEAEDIKKMWQEYTEELYKKIFMTQTTTMV